MLKRKPRSLWPMLTAALLGLPVLYVASFGPVCWIVSRTEIDRGSIFQIVYWPLGWAILNGGPPISDRLCAYVRLGMPKNEDILIPSSDVPSDPDYIWKSD